MGEQWQDQCSGVFFTLYQIVIIPIKDSSGLLSFIDQSLSVQCTFQKNQIYFMINFLTKTYALSSNRCGEIIFWTDYNPVKHLSPKWSERNPHSIPWSFVLNICSTGSRDHCVFTKENVDCIISHEFLLYLLVKCLVHPPISRPHECVPVWIWPGNFWISFTI